jgi:lipoprotein signal peptidase
MDSPLNKIQRIKWLEIIFCFCMAWWLFMLFVYSTDISRSSLPPEIKTTLSVKIDLLNIFIPAFICCAIGAGINYSNTGSSYRTTFSRIAIFVFVLVLIDQIIKFLLFSHFGDSITIVTGESESYTKGYLDTRSLPPPIFVIVKDWLFIQPVLHKAHLLQTHGIYLSWQLRFLLASFGLLVFYRYARVLKADNRLVDCFIIWLGSATICNLMDHLFYGGSIDYMRLVQFAIFDAKDVYALLGVAVYVQANIHNRKWQIIKRSLSLKGGLADLKKYIKYERAAIENIKTSFNKISRRSSKE